MQGYLTTVGDGEGLRLGNLLPNMGSVAIGVATRGTLVVADTGARQDGGLGELLRCGLVACVCVLGVVFFERDFFSSFVPLGLIERFPVLRRFMKNR